MALNSLSFVSCIALTGLAGLLASATSALAGGECCSGAGKAQVVAAAGAQTECSAVGKAQIVAAAGEGECAAKGECAAEGAAVVMAVGDSVECAACDAVHTAFAPINAECPGSGEAITEGVTAQFAGFTVGFCCEDCQTGFNAKSDDEKAATVAKMVHVVNTECPGSGEAVSAEQVALYNGFAVGFCCEDCKAKFTASDDAGKSATLAKYVKAVNTECPGSGEAISGDTFFAYHGVLIGFCCENCQASFMSADAEKQKMMAMKLVADANGGHTEECKAAYAKSRADS